MGIFYVINDTVNKTCRHLITVTIEISEDYGAAEPTANFHVLNALMIVRGCPQMADKVISCGVCKKLPESPRKLPCNHVFCESCLRGFIASHQYDKFGYFPCPQCRYGIIVPIGGIRQFKFYDSSIGFKCKDEIVPPDLHFLLREPVGLACTSNDLVAISDRDGNKLLLFTLHRELVSRFFCKVKINSLIVSDADTLLVTNNDIHQPLVLEFGLNGVRSGIVDTLDKMVPTDGVALLRNPKQIVVSSVETSTLYILDENGKLLKKYSGKSLLGNPQFLSANSQNEIIVSDNLNHFVKVVDHNGKLKVSYNSSNFK